jgi:hypothetical protein
MKINVSRIIALLRPEGFVLGRTSRIEKSFAFVRPDQRPELYQWIIVNCAGKNGEAVVGKVAVALTTHKGLKGLMKSQLLFEIAQVKERGWTKIYEAAEARAWEREFVAIAPRRAVELAAEAGAELLETTKSARNAAHAYLEHLDLSKPVPELLNEAISRVDSRRLAEAQKLAEAPAVLQVFGAQDIYLLACLCILEYEEEVEDVGTSFYGQKPIQNKQLMWRIQLIADRLLHISTITPEI